jgi:hypothetical protein
VDLGRGLLGRRSARSAWCGPFMYLEILRVDVMMFRLSLCCLAYLLLVVVDIQSRLKLAPWMFH